MYKLRVPQGAQMPLAWYKTDIRQMDTFKDQLVESGIEFHLISGTSGTTEIENMLIYLNALYHNSSFTVTSNTLIQMEFIYADLIDVPADTESGSQEYYEYIVDYEAIMQRS